MSTSQINPALQALINTFKSINSAYYFRHLIFAIPASYIGFTFYSNFDFFNGVNFGTVTLMCIISLLYPYSHFVFDKLANFIMGNHVNQYDALPTALFKMTVAWLLCPVLAPFGLLFLYLKHANEPDTVPTQTPTEGRSDPSVAKYSSE